MTKYKMSFVIDDVKARFQQLKSLNDIALVLFNANEEKFAKYSHYMLEVPYESIRHNRVDMIHSVVKYDMIQSDDLETIAFLKAVLAVFSYVKTNAEDILKDIDDVFQEAVWTQLE